MPSVTSNRPPLPPAVTTSIDHRPLSSPVENCSTAQSAVPSGGCSGVVNGVDVNVWIGRDNDEQLQHAVEMSRLLTTSMFMSGRSFSRSIDINK